MSNRSVMVTLRANVADFTSNMRQASSSLEDLVKRGDATGKVAETGLGRMAQSMQLQRAEWDQLGNTMLGVGTAGSVAFGGMAKSAIDYESAFAGVKKTVDGTPEQIDALNTSIRNMAREMPASHAEIAGVAEAAGQLGIEIPNIEGFTRSMIALGSSTNMSADEAATAIARFANIMGTSQTEFSNIGSSIVALGNNFATTEAEITNMAQRLASAGNQIGLTEGDVLGIATALSSVGIEAEAGGTAFSNVMIEMRKAVDEGGESLDVFAKTAGMSGAQFQKAFKEDAAGAITAFVQGLAQMEASGQSMQPVLDELGLTDIRVGNALRSSAAAADKFTDAIEMGNTAYTENTALMNEYEQRVGTTASQLQILKNTVVDAGISLGSVMLPGINFVAGALADFAGMIADLPAPIQAVITTLGGVVSVATLAGGAFFTLAPRVMETWAAFGSLAGSIPGVSRALDALSGPAGMAATGLKAIGKYVVLPVAAVVAVGAVTKGFLEMAGVIDRNVTGVEELQNKILGMKSGDSFYEKIIGDIGDVNTQQFTDLAETFERIARPGVADSLFGKSFLDSTGFKEVSGQLEVLDQQITSLSRTDLSAATSQFQAMWDEAGGGQQALEDMLVLFPGYKEALLGAANSAGVYVSEAELAALLTGEFNNRLEGTGDAAASADDGLTLVSRKSTEVAEASDAAAENLQQMFEVIAGSDASFISMIDGYNSASDAAKSWADEIGAAYDGASFAMDDYLAALDEQVAAQQEWEQNMLLLSGRVSQGVLDELSRLGPEGAPLVAGLVDASEDELARMESAFGQGATDAASTFADNLQNAGPVISEVMRVAGDDAAAAAAEALASGTSTLQDVIDQYDLNIKLDTGEAEAELEDFRFGVNDLPPTVEVVADMETTDAISELFGWTDQVASVPPFAETKAEFDAWAATQQGEGWKQTIDSIPDTSETDANYNTAAGISNVTFFNNTLGTIPKATNTTANVRDNGSWVVSGLRNSLASLTDRTVTVTVRQVGASVSGIAASMASLAAGRASGGSIFGPGTETSDSIPIWASHNEHMWSAREVKGAGGHGTMELMRAMAREGSLLPMLLAFTGAERHASGGPVGAVGVPPVVVPSQQQRVVVQQAPVLLDGARITGMLDLGGGLSGFVDGRIDVNDRRRAGVGRAGR